MRRLALILTGALLVTFMAVACTETPAEPLQATDAATPMFDFSNGPASPGNSPVKRFDEYTDGELLFDEESGYYVYVTSEGAVCDFTDLVERASHAQAIRSPAEEGLFLRHDLETANAVIATEEHCDYVVAYGTVHIVRTDNDRRAYQFDHRRHNAFGFSLNGHLTGVGGPDMNIHIRSRCVWEGFDAGPAKCVEKFTIR